MDSMLNCGRAVDLWRGYLDMKNATAADICRPRFVTTPIHEYAEALARYAKLAPATVAFSDYLSGATA
jgi:hypothetical protein